MDNGKVVEYDAPQELLKNNQSAFYQMAKDAGLVWEKWSNTLK